MDFLRRVFVAMSAIEIVDDVALLTVLFAVLNTDALWPTKMLVVTWLVVVSLVWSLALLVYFLRVPTYDPAAILALAVGGPPANAIRRDRARLGAYGAALAVACAVAMLLVIQVSIGWDRGSITTMLLVFGLAMSAMDAVASYFGLRYA